MAERNFKDYIQAKRELEEKLAKAGIPETEYLALFHLLETVTGTYLEDARQNQFHDDAYELAVDIQSATDKKTRQIAVYLRRFAEHIVRHTCSIEEPEKIEDIVDRLPQINDESAS